VYAHHLVGRRSRDFPWTVTSLANFASDFWKSREPSNGVDPLTLVFIAWHLLKGHLKPFTPANSFLSTRKSWHYFNFTRSIMSGPNAMNFTTKAESTLSEAHSLASSYSHIESKPRHSMTIFELANIRSSHPSSHRFCAFVWRWPEFTIAKYLQQNSRRHHAIRTEHSQTTRSITLTGTFLNFYLNKKLTVV